MELDAEGGTGLPNHRPGDVDNRLDLEPRKRLRLAVEDRLDDAAPVADQDESDATEGAYLV